MVTKRDLSDIKQDIQNLIGNRIRLKTNKGRKRVSERVGILEETYPNIFIVKLDEKKSAVRRVSYSYTDVLTETIELSVCPDDAECANLECQPSASKLNL